MEDLTPTQQRILAFIAACCHERRLPPTVREIAVHMGYRSDNAAHQHVKALERKGAITRAGGSRGIRLCAPTGLPVVGRVAAGAPVLAAEHIEDHVEGVAALFRARADYLLRVHGENMQGAGILGGDLLAVRRQATAECRQIVVARVDGEVTVKRFTRQGRVVTLVPENPAFAPIEVDLQRQAFALEGIMVGLIRPGAS